MKAGEKRWGKEVDEGGEGGGEGALKGRDLVMGVPPGTFVRTKGGKVLADLTLPGQSVLVAKGGEGGVCVLKEERKGEDAMLRMKPKEMKQLVKGGGGEQVCLELLLRTVADVGFVGYPNAGKSTLLSALSRASPEVAPFPFTTMMPNLGVMASPTSPSTLPSPSSKPPLLADLPGLVDGAHQGKGLGRVFLRHLRRVKLVLYVLDSSPSSSSHPTEQYESLRRELKLYNPQYLERPHVVAVNKLDLAWEEGGQALFDERRRELAQQIAASAAAASEETALPLAIVPLSGKRGRGLGVLRRVIESALQSEEGEEHC
ncbi:MAG: hypothetical protein SGPRY_009968 [Prymnesium sp.]